MYAFQSWSLLMWLLLDNIDQPRQTSWDVFDDRREDELSNSTILLLARLECNAVLQFLVARRTVTSSESYQFWELPVLRVTSSEGYQFWGLPVLRVTSSEGYQFWGKHWMCVNVKITKIL
jgi:hypothetical protein